MHYAYVYLPRGIPTRCPVIVFFDHVYTIQQYTKQKALDKKTHGTKVYDTAADVYHKKAHVAKSTRPKVKNHQYLLPRSTEEELHKFPPETVSIQLSARRENPRKTSFTVSFITQSIAGIKLPNRSEAKKKLAAEATTKNSRQP